MCNLAMLFKIPKKYGLLASVALSFLTQCKEKTHYTDDTYFGSKVMVLGHRGMGELYRMPGNTYAAIYPVMALGVMALRWIFK